MAQAWMFLPMEILIKENLYRVKHMEKGNTLGPLMVNFMWENSETILSMVKVVGKVVQECQMLTSMTVTI